MRRKIKAIEFLEGNAGKCKHCGHNGARLHSIIFGRATKDISVKYYVDCECRKGCITDWYSSEEEAIAAWNANREVR